MGFVVCGVFVVLIVYSILGELLAFVVIVCEPVACLLDDSVGFCVYVVYRLVLC